MASNEVEVLDSAPTVEKLKKFASERVLNRRHFIAAIGAAGAAVAGTELVRQGPTALAQQPKPSGYAQGDILNFLLNLNYLKATLYSFICTGADLPTATFTNLGSGGVFNPPKQVPNPGASGGWAAAGPASGQEIQDLFNEMAYDEVQMLIALRALIGTAAVGGRPTMNLAGTGTTTVTATQTVSPNQAIGLARMLEDLTASAYATATVYLTGTNLAYATQALATIGAHAGAIRLIAIQAAAPYVAAQILTTTGPTTQSQNSFTGSMITGSTTIYNFAPTNPITVGSIITGTGIPLNTTVTAVNPPTVYTATMSGTSATPNNVLTNVTPITGLQVGMALAGSGIPSNSVITNIAPNSGGTSASITIGTITGFSALTPPTPIFNSITGINGQGGFLMTPGTYPLVFAGGGGTGAAGTITVITAGTTAAQPGTYSIVLTAIGSGYISAPTVTAGTGGTPPTLAATVATGITTSAANVTVTPGFTGATTKGSTGLVLVSQTAGLTPAQLITGTNLPSNEYISTAAGAINSGAGTILLGGAVASATSSVAPTGVVTKSSAVVTSVSSTSGILFGAPITGTGIPAGATVVSVGQDVNGPNITMSAAATTTTTGTSTVAPTGQLTLGSTTVQALSSLSGLAAGNTVTGVGIQSGTTIVSVGGVNTMVLSKTASANTVLTTKATPTAVLASGNNIVSNVYPMTNLANGQLVSDVLQGNVPPGTTITGVTASSNTIALSAPATGATTLTNVATCTGTIVASYETISSISPASVLTTLAALPSTNPNPGGIGLAISGPNIPSGTIITGISASAGTITISQFPSAANGAQLIGAALVIQQGEVLTASALTAMTVTAPTTSEAVTIPTLINFTPSLGTATLSQAATVTGPNTLLVATADPMDVNPVDPGTLNFSGSVTSGSTSITFVSNTAGLAAGQLITGPGIPASTTIATVTSATQTITISNAATATNATASLSVYLTNSAALASAGPSVMPGTSPSVYQGFFDTASASTSTANNPAGSVFARTFSQVLADLYGSTASQTYEGGFFPVGIGGPINFV